MAVLHEPSNTYARDFRRVVSRPLIRSGRFAAPVSPAVVLGPAVPWRAGFKSALPCLMFFL